MSIDWSKPCLLGTELEVVADFDLQPLLGALLPHVDVLRNSVDDGRHTLWLDLVRTGNSVDDAILKWVQLIEALPTDVRRLWDTSTDRCFNTGIQAGLEPHAFPVQLSADSFARAARIAVRHQFTVYAPRDEISPKRSE